MSWVCSENSTITDFFSPFSLKHLFSPPQKLINKWVCGEPLPQNRHTVCSPQHTSAWTAVWCFKIKELQIGFTLNLGSPLALQYIHTLSLCTMLHTNRHIVNTSCVSFSDISLFNGPTLMCPPCSSSTSTCSLAWLHSFQIGRLRLGGRPLCHPALRASGPFPKPCPHSPAWYPPPSPQRHGWERNW